MISCNKFIVLHTIHRSNESEKREKTVPTAPTTKTPVWGSQKGYKGIAKNKWVNNKRCIPTNTGEDKTNYKRQRRFGKTKLAFVKYKYTKEKTRFGIYKIYKAS